jgi:hypothetical protein
MIHNPMPFTYITDFWDALVSDLDDLLMKLPSMPAPAVDSLIHFCMVS